MSMDDIEKLKARVEKDPSSKLFLPLAEEYRKAGMLDEAISVLLKGLERQPGYSSARVALGKIYLEKKMIEDAKREFEKVVEVVPDNLFAHKKLAEIYRDIGEIDRAISEYKTVIQINPLDEDARSFIESVEEKVHNEILEPAESLSVESVEEVTEEAGRENTAEPEVTESFEPAELPLEESTIEEHLEERTEEESFNIPEDVGLGIEEPLEMLPEDLTEVRQQLPDIEEVESVLDHGELAELLETEGFPETVSEAEPMEESVQERVFYKESPDVEKVELIHEDLDLADADSFVSSRQYYKALDSYKSILKEFPDNKKVLQRIAELKHLLKLLGKDQEIIVKLEALLEGIRRRRDEFFSSS